MFDWMTTNFKTTSGWSMISFDLYGGKIKENAGKNSFYMRNAIASI